MKREVLDKIGDGLDRCSDLSLFDTDILSAKAMQAGYTLAVCKDLFVHHFGTRTFAQRQSDAGSYSFSPLIRLWLLYRIGSLKGRSIIRRSDSRMRKRLYRRAVDADPGRHEAWHCLGLACIAQDKLADCVRAFQRHVDAAPQNVDTLTQLGIALARQSRLPEALAKFRQAIELKPDHAKAHNNLGVVLDQLGRPDEGMACYSEAARLQPDYAEAHFNMGVYLGDRKQNEEAIACL